MPDIAAIRPLRDLLLVKRYTKPEEVRGIIIPETYQGDDTRSLWELIAQGPKAAEVLGQTLDGDLILQTPPHRGVNVPGEDDYFFISAREVINVIRWA